MTPNEAWKEVEEFYEGHSCCIMTDEAREALTALLRRDWAVRVLDAHQEHDGRAYVTVTAPFQFESKEWGHKFATGRYSTPDAARLAAAKAVYPTLPDTARAQLGEAP